MNKEFVEGLEIEFNRGNVEFKDLMNDFEFVKELNKELSLKYQDFVDSLPKPEEIDLIIEELENDIDVIKNNFESIKDSNEKIKEIDKRLLQLTRFRSAAVLLEKDDPESVPDKFEDLFNGK